MVEGDRIPRMVKSWIGFSVWKAWLGGGGCWKGGWCYEAGSPHLRNMSFTLCKFFFWWTRKEWCCHILAHWGKHPLYKTHGDLATRFLLLKTWVIHLLGNSESVELLFYFAGLLQAQPKTYTTGEWTMEDVVDVNSGGSCCWLSSSDHCWVL